ncbi:bifunctional uroporphyrinogen-III C-methyltransferase/uroporphyrinogen-III synthase [Tessaracoccus antarcticus]|uniref:Bifunctional uroporphyrinogen-III C-methyltransferase/uroporphyrinogen-III synthase n=1 Tax=Tessaracoccus antarcticus TaxID=2479848 RepID=A0A3M0G7Y0_9ACTN|nr:bifunctional uroporphyrinogen-III C-methyltransferase/uroporphyrinogen-III synthase [Tessaracoccus antarcticus]
MLAETDGAVGSLTVVGAGPGDPELMALSGAKAISRADLVVVDSDDAVGIIAALGIDSHAQVVVAAKDQYRQLVTAIDEGRHVVRVTADDHLLNGFHANSLPRVLETHRNRTHVVPGISRWDCALNFGAVAPTASLAMLDASLQVPDKDEWPTAGTTIIWTTARLLKDVAAQGARLHGVAGQVLEITRLGSTSQVSRLVTWGELDARDVDPHIEYYLVTGPGIVDGARGRLDWFGTKPLFDWSVLIPRTKDDFDDLIEQLSRYGASSEVVATLSIEPPRTEQGMEKAIRGLVDGRYLWIIFTSPHAVEAIIERLAEYGLDSRALSGILIAAVGRGSVEALGRHGLKADLVPVGDNTAGGLAVEFPAHDILIDPLDRVLVPSADVSVTALLEGLGRLGWEAEEVTAYRTVRAAPPPAELRERIKDGMFDAVVFTSSTAVRNMIGIAGKPHAASVVAAIGPATAAACEMHGLRVDVVAEAPTFESVAEGLARFADRRKAERSEQGLPEAKPSERKRRKRRKAPVDGA